MLHTKDSELRSARQEYISRYGFHLMVGGFILIVSFFYGISVGMKRGPHHAFAAQQGASLIPANADLASEFSEADLPRGVNIVPLGDEITIDSNQAKMVSFTSERSIRALVEEQSRKWEASGMRIFRAATEQRGFILGLSSSLNKRYLFIATSVAPSMRNVLTQGKRVQGYLSIVDANVTKNSGIGASEVPGVPLMPDGHGGAVFSSADVGGRSYSSVYTNPGSIEDGLEFYRDVLSGDGWRESQGGEDVAEKLGYSVGSLTLRRGSEEIVLLFSPAVNSVGQARNGSETAGEKTVVIVARGPIQVSSGQMIYDR